MASPYSPFALPHQASAFDLLPRHLNAHHQRRRPLCTHRHRQHGGQQRTATGRSRRGGGAGWGGKRRRGGRAAAKAGRSARCGACRAASGAAFAMHAATWVAMVDTKVAVVLMLVVPGCDLDGVEASGSGGLHDGKKRSRWGRGALGLSARAPLYVCVLWPWMG